MTDVPRWPDVLTLRPEVVASDGGVGDLQMSLYKAVYQTADVPYRDVSYYSDITEPTSALIGFFGRIARRLGSTADGTALFHLDQGMGGGKSHALVGLYHMASRPEAFFATELGIRVLTEAQADGRKTDISGTTVVTLTADNFSPGRTSETFGPATNLFGRFLWSLLDGDRSRYDRFLAMGPNKATIRAALSEVDGPVLILLDELMDYALDLSTAENVETMPAEQAFLNALADACDDVPRVAFVVVMIRSELDPEGYPPVADDFRAYVSRRLERNGTKVPVTEPADFAAIIRRRVFERGDTTAASDAVAAAYKTVVQTDPAWAERVLDRLGPGRSVDAIGPRIRRTYPFHPDLMDLVQEEWSAVQGFQRVRSTVSIFALAALHWHRVAAARGWVPALIGVGDLPLAGIRGTGDVPQPRCLDAILNSGLLLNNDRMVQGYRAVATTDVTGADGSSGRAVEIDGQLADSGLDAGQPSPAVRMATALFVYSLVARTRPRGQRGATGPELLSAVMQPGLSPSFAEAEQVLDAVVGPDGLGAIEVAEGHTTRYWLTIKQTLRMYFAAARSQVSDDDSLALVWETAQRLTSKGSFGQVVLLDRPEDNQTLRDVAAGLDSAENRLVVLDPRRWTLLNGDDSRSRTDVENLLGVGPAAIPGDFAASCVIAAVNTYSRRYAAAAAKDYLTWRIVESQVTEDDERQQVARTLHAQHQELEVKTKNAFRHFAYVRRDGDRLEVVFDKFDDDRRTSLSGADVWGALAHIGRAVGQAIDPSTLRVEPRPLHDRYLALLLDDYDRELSLREVTESFYRNPRFPLVPSTNDIKRAIHSLLQPVGHAGEGSGGWEIVDDNGNRLAPEVEQIAYTSIQQRLRRARAGTGDTHPDDTDTTAPVGNRRTAAPEPGDTRGSGAHPTTYAWYRLIVENRSLSDPDKLAAITNHLKWLAALLEDEPELAPQLLTLRYELNIGDVPELRADFEHRARLIDASFRAESDDLL